MATFFTTGESGLYEQVMQQKPKYGKDDYGCNGCPHHRPEWKYRFCVFTECKFVSGFFTFKENE